MNQSAVAEATGISQPTLSRWSHDGLLPNGKAPGRGAGANLTLTDVAKILCIRDLRNQGARLKTIKKALNKLRGKGIDDWHSEWLAVTPEGDIVWLDGARDAFYRLRDGQSYVLDVAGIRDEIEEKAGEIVDLQRREAATG